MRALLVICCSALLVACDVATSEEGQSSPVPSTADGSASASPSPTAGDAPTPTPTPISEPEVDLLIADGVRLDRLENNGGRTLATVTNLNSLPVDAQVDVLIFPGAGHRILSLSGSTTLDSGGTGSVLLEEDDGEAVDCSIACNYAFSVDADVAETDEEPHTNETSCTPAVCRLDPAPTPTSSG